MAPRQPNPWLTVTEAARFLGVSPTSLRDARWRRRKGIPHHKVWGRLVFDRLELAAYLARQQPASRERP